MCGIDFLFWFSFGVVEKVNLVRNEFGLVRFKNMRFSSDIITSYYSCNS